MFADEEVSNIDKTRQCPVVNNFSKVDKCFNQVGQLAESIKNKEVKQCVSLHLETTRDTLMRQSLINPKAMRETAEILHENMDEILSECPDNNLKMEIQKCLGELCEQLSALVKVKGSPDNPKGILFYS